MADLPAESIQRVSRFAKIVITTNEELLMAIQTETLLNCAHVACLGT